MMRDWLNMEVNGRADVVGNFPDEGNIIPLIGAVLFERNQDWQSQYRHVMVEAFNQIDPPSSIAIQAA